MIQGKLLSYGSDLSEVFFIRKKVFVEEIGVSENVVFDDADNEAIHVLVYEEPLKEKSIISKENAIATGRIVLDGNRCIISNIAVLKEYRNKEYGDFTVKMLLNKAFTSGVNEVIADSFSGTVKFFEKIGFKIYDTEENINELKLYRMVIHSNDIIKSCQSCHN